MEPVERSLATPDVGRLPTIMPAIAKRHWLDSPDKFSGKVFIHKVTGNKPSAVLPKPRSPLAHQHLDGLAS
jgi:hypothetical protein